jgi:glucan phosphoethanolaminetransferase (alkaline phosphatase superfamily)
VTSAKRALLYMVMADLGTAAVLLHLAARAFDWPDFVKGLPVGIMIVALALLLRRKLRDEYIESLWSAGTSLAFAAAVLLFLFLPFAEGFIDGFVNAPKREDSATALAPTIIIAAFFAGFQLRRWRPVGWGGS